MLPINDLGSDSPLYFSLLEHPCTHNFKLIASPVVTLALWFRAQSRCPETNHRPCASVETRTCTNPSTEYCSAKCSPLARESRREWIQIRQSIGQFQLHPDRQLANRTAHRRANLRGNAELDSRELAASLLSPKSAPCVLVDARMLSTSGRHSPITSSLSAFQMRDSTQRSALRVCHFLACLFVDSRASQINSSQINLGGAHDVSKQRSS
jgi:hypothetical protein